MSSEMRLIGVARGDPGERSRGGGNRPRTICRRRRPAQFNRSDRLALAGDNTRLSPGQKRVSLVISHPNRSSLATRQAVSFPNPGNCSCGNRGSNPLGEDIRFSKLSYLTEACVPAVSRWLVAII